MKNQFVTYEIAQRLKELGFNEPCLKWYSSNGKLHNNVGDILSENQNTLYGCCAAPLWQQIIDWLYYPHNIVIGYDYQTDLFTVSKTRNLLSQEGTEEAAILNALELISKN